MSSRLFQEIREKRGLVYSMFSSLGACDDSGLFSIYAGTGPDQTEELVKVLCDEIMKVSDGISEDEITRAKAQLKAGLLMGLESPGSRCVQRARQILVYGKPLETQEIIDKVENVDRTAVVSATQAIFSTAAHSRSGRADRPP